MHGSVTLEAGENSNSLSSGLMKYWPGFCSEFTRYADEGYKQCSHHTQKSIMKDTNNAHELLLHGYVYSGISTMRTPLVPSECPE